MHSGNTPSNLLAKAQMWKVSGPLQRLLHLLFVPSADPCHKRVTWSTEVLFWSPDDRGAFCPLKHHPPGSCRLTASWSGMQVLLPHDQPCGARAVTTEDLHVPARASCCSGCSCPLSREAEYVIVNIYFICEFPPFYWDFHHTTIHIPFLLERI